MTFIILGRQSFSLQQGWKWSCRIYKGWKIIIFHATDHWRPTSIRMDTMEDFKEAYDWFFPSNIKLDWLLNWHGLISMSREFIIKDDCYIWPIFSLASKKNMCFNRLYLSKEFAEVRVRSNSQSGKIKILIWKMEISF